MTPLMSWPGIQPSSLLRNDRNSPRLSENARTATNASPGPGVSSGTSRTSTGTDPLGVLTTARMLNRLLPIRERLAGKESPWVLVQNGKYVGVGQTACAQHRNEVSKEIRVSRRPFSFRPQIVDMGLFGGRHLTRELAEPTTVPVLAHHDLGAMSRPHE